MVKIPINHSRAIFKKIFRFPTAGPRTEHSQPASRNGGASRKAGLLGPAWSPAPGTVEVPLEEAVPWQVLLARTSGKMGIDINSS